MPHYSSEVKEAMVQKLCTPGGPSAYRLAQETGISQGSLLGWKKEFGSTKKLSKKNRRPQDWDAEEKLKAVLEAKGLDEPALGEFLRKSGLHTHDLEEWEKEIFDLVVESKKKRGRPRKDPELVAAEGENKMLKRDLRRKEKALAEQTAIVILQKKAQEIWGTDEDDE